MLSGLNADRLAFEPDFLGAMPPGVQKVIDRIRPTGNFNAYSSTLRFARRPETPQVAAPWDMQLACHQAALRGDLPLENITGGIRLMGTSDGPNASLLRRAGDRLADLERHAVHQPPRPVLERQYHLLPRSSRRRPSSPSRRAASRPTSSAAASPPTSSSNTPVSPATTPRFRSAAIDLARFARERLGGPNDLTGTVSGKLSLDGAGRSTYALNGNGDLHVVDANIYQLPPLVAMLKVLRNRTPDTTAFDRCDMQFDVRGEHIHFQQLNLLGDAVSLYGRGETNFDRRLDLTFYTLVGPADLPIPLWKTVASHLSEQGLQIKVDGTWDNPQTTPRGVPGREPDARTDPYRSRTRCVHHGSARVRRNPLGHAAAIRVTFTSQEVDNERRITRRNHR